MTEPVPRLYNFYMSHFNEKARWALDFKGVRHRRTLLVPGFHVPVVRILTGQNKVPVLRIGGDTIFDSSNILQELERRYPAPALMPADPTQKQRALALEDYFDEEVAPALRRLFWSCYVGDAAATATMACAHAPGAARLAFRASWPLVKPLFLRNMGLSEQNLTAARSGLRGYFDRLESDVGPSGYLVGDTFTLADLTAAAVMTALLRPPEFSYPLPEPWPAALHDVRDSVREHPAAQWVFEIYRKHRGTSAAC